MLVNLPRSVSTAPTALNPNLVYNRTPAGEDKTNASSLCSSTSRQNNFHQHGSNALSLMGWIDCHERDAWKRYHMSKRSSKKMCELTAYLAFLLGVFSRYGAMRPRLAKECPLSCSRCPGAGSPPYESERRFIYSAYCL